MENVVSIIICGVMGEGKTYRIVDILKHNKDRNIFLFNSGQDKEYDCLELSNNWRDKRSQQENLDENLFIERALTKYNCDIVFEEATAFIESRSSQLIKRLIVKSSPHHNNNRLFWVFHDISSIPRDLIRKSSLLILFKTGDTPEDVKSKDKRILPFYNKLKGTPQRTFISVNLKKL